MSLSSKVNTILKFELAYFDLAVKHINHFVILVSSRFISGGVMVCKPN